MVSGGPAHTDVHGIHYQADSLRIGIASDYGSRLPILRVDPRDAILYQTERYWLRVSEVKIGVSNTGHFESPYQKRHTSLKFYKISITDFSTRLDSFIHVIKIKEQMGTEKL